MNARGTLCPLCFGKCHQVAGAGFIAKKNGKQSMGLLGPEHTPRKDAERGARVIPGTKSPERRLGRETEASGAEEGWKPQTQRMRGRGGLGLRGPREGVTHNLL